MISLQNGERSDVRRQHPLKLVEIAVHQVAAPGLDQIVINQERPAVGVLRNLKMKSTVDLRIDSEFLVKFASQGILR